MVSDPPPHVLPPSRLYLQQAPRHNRSRLGLIRTISHHVRRLRARDAGPHRHYQHEEQGSHDSTHASRSGRSRRSACARASLDRDRLGIGLKEGKQATHWTRLSCHRFRANEVRLQLSVLAYNLGNLWRRLGLPQRIKSWSLTSLQHRLMKTDGRLVKHARYYWLLLAEGHLNRKLFGEMLGRIDGLALPSG